MQQETRRKRREKVATARRGAARQRAARRRATFHAEAPQRATTVAARATGMKTDSQRGTNERTVAPSVGRAREGGRVE